MSTDERRVSGGARSAHIRLWVGLGVLAAAVTPVLLGSSAGAASADTTTTCPNSGYSSATIANCDTTTTSGGAQAQLSLTVKYPDQDLGWQACVRPAGAQGSVVNLFVDGQEENKAGGSGSIESDGCTTAESLPICLAQGTYSVTAVDQAVGNDTKTLTVPASRACESVASSTSKSGGGALAFTGSDILRLVVFAAILLVLGYAVVRFNRLRRQRN